MVRSVFNLMLTVCLPSAQVLDSPKVQQIPAQSAFPIPYHDDFNCKQDHNQLIIMQYFSPVCLTAYESESEAAYFADQSGTFQIYDTQSPRKMVMRQVCDTLLLCHCLVTC